MSGLADYEGSDAFSDLEKDVLRFAEQWTRDGKASAAVVDRLAGSLSADDLVVLAATVGLANLTSRFNRTFGVELP